MKLQISNKNILLAGAFNLHVVFQCGDVIVIGEAVSSMLYHVNSELVKKRPSTHQPASTLHSLDMTTATVNH